MLIYYLQTLSLLIYLRCSRTLHLMNMIIKILKVWILIKIKIHRLVLIYLKIVLSYKM
jgi:hypothetical protein